MSRGGGARPGPAGPSLLVMASRSAPPGPSNEGPAPSRVARTTPSARSARVGVIWRTSKFT
ncbi:hypothetical protein [Brachybacterium sacelli]|uniref:hypothetical protein n=1 Tax=Brachybacterium sacelli TaxID=173364 RepID=UPI00360DF2E5